MSSGASKRNSPVILSARPMVMTTAARSAVTGRPRSSASVSGDCSAAERSASSLMKLTCVRSGALAANPRGLARTNGIRQSTARLPRVPRGRSSPTEPDAARGQLKAGAAALVPHTLALPGAYGDDAGAGHEQFRPRYQVGRHCARRAVRVSAPPVVRRQHGADYRLPADPSRAQASAAPGLSGREAADWAPAGAASATSNAAAPARAWILRSPAPRARPSLDTAIPSVRVTQFSFRVFSSTWRDSSPHGDLPCKKTKGEPGAFAPGSPFQLPP